ncbi:hypothetical protein RN001_006745 [Aquatica leii]|uniref:Uncharacterized protein n=1 Tax=Aquatica leii TaxID=1421715 RepID=A0AAN7SBM2_9COLE|nr:hypothetical protein RN001_006745 [Aquatica leii]
MARRNLFLQALTIFVFVSIVFCKLPDYIQVCQRNVPDIDQCIINSIEHLKPYLKTGIPEINVPSLEPLRINETVPMNLGNGDTKILTNLTELAVYGASSFEIQKLWSNIAENSFRYNVSLPAIVLKGVYEIDTKLLFLLIRGKGNVTINIDNYNFECIMSGDRIQIENVEHLKFDQLECEIQFEKASIRLSNLFNGNALLGNAVNDVVNDNIDVFFNEIKPKITEAIGNVFKDVANKITLQHLKPYLKVGIPELNIPALEPLRINGTISLDLGTGDTKILTNFSDLALHGASTFKIDKLWANIEENVFRYNVSLPVFIVNGTYEIDTKLLFLNVIGKGGISINLEKYNFECSMTGKKIQIQNDEYLKFDKLNCDIQFEKATVWLENLFGGNKLIGNAVNDVINDNFDIFFAEMKPKIIAVISDIFLDVANKITLRFTYADLFPKK